MSASLHFRIERLARHCGHSSGRLIVVKVQDSHVYDDALLSATLSEAGISRTDRDPADPPCALVSVTALHPARRGATR